LKYWHNVWYGETGVVWLQDGKKIEDMFSGFSTIPACDEQMDGHLATTYAALCIASRGKNREA